MNASAPLVPVRPKRLLSIDGGGLAGLIPAESLILIEKQLDDITGESKPLCDRFDLIGGTSTGAILAAGLCLGLRAEELRNFYLDFGKDIFAKVFLPIRFWHSYPSQPLERHLKDVFGENTTLGGAQLHTQLLIVAKNATQGTTWFFSNNPNGKYFGTNAALPLWHIVRASSAAPTFFPPQKINVPDDQGQIHNYEFIDGGVSSYNNPSLQLFLEATDRQYNYGWPTGTEKLLLLSLGTGFNTATIDEGKASSYNLLDWARYSVKGLLGDANLQQNVLMRLIGQHPAGPVVVSTAERDAVRASGAPAESVLASMDTGLAMKKLLTYQRITVSLTRARLDGLGLTDIDPVKVREMDAVDQIGNIQRVGAAVAKEQVNMNVLKQFFS
ncbi:MAG: patatin-like phospholipase family protein [Acidobacteria bacterium]|nr:patatin-like phospholipase family protein [Acidobacteriota bacterium]